VVSVNHAGFVTLERHGLAFPRWSVGTMVDDKRKVRKLAEFRRVLQKSGITHLKIEGITIHGIA
jgi:hypothetical protein